MRDITLLNKLNLGCGNHIREDFVNLDIAAIPGVDVVCDITSFPWNLADNQFEYIEAHNILEHLPNTVRTMEELWRISKNGGSINIRVPYWNSLDWASDPTHLRRFSQYSFNFFDPTTRQGKERPYYSTARFRIAEIAYWLPLAPERSKYWVRVSNPVAKRIVGFFARYFCNVIWTIEFTLVTMK